MGFDTALIGAGAMGGAIGTRLVETGHTLRVFDLDDERVNTLAALGAIPAASAADAANGVEFCVISLNSAEIVERAVFGENGVAVQAKPGTLLIDMSSIAPDATRQLAERAADKGLGWVDSPLSGGAPKALIGELTLMLGGTENNVRKAQTLLKDVAANMTHMGPSGAGQTTKLINQVLSAALAFWP